MKNTQHCKEILLESGSVKYYAEVSGEGKPLICLHGFSEDHTTWEGIDLAGYASYRIDIVGHGKTEKPKEPEFYCIEAVLEQLYIFIHRLVKTNYTIMGYSMGGRIALAYALTYPDEIDTLILESSGIGIEREAERLARKESDRILAERIKKNKITWFQEYWSGLSIFDTQKRLPESVREKIKQRRLKNSEIALANVLIECSQANLPYYGDQIKLLKMPVLYLSGELDEKYSILGEKLARENRNIMFVKVQNAGHNVHLEQPDKFNQITGSFLKNT